MTRYEDAIVPSLLLLLFLPCLPHICLAGYACPLSQLLDKASPDLLICDPFCLPCLDLAYLRDIPYVRIGQTYTPAPVAGGEW